MKTLFVVGAKLADEATCVSGHDMDLGCAQYCCGVSLHSSRSSKPPCPGYMIRRPRLQDKSAFLLTFVGKLPSPGQSSSSARAIVRALELDVNKVCLDVQWLAWINLDPNTGI